LKAAWLQPLETYKVISPGGFFKSLFFKWVQNLRCRYDEGEELPLMGSLGGGAVKVEPLC
jgi:hypothetical protein